MIRHLLPILALLLGLSTVAAAETRFFDLQHRRGAEVADTVRAVLDEDARVTALDRSVVVTASPAQLAIAAELLARLDRPPRLLRIVVAQGVDASGTREQAAVSGRIEAGDAAVVIGRPRGLPPGAGVVIDDGDGSRARLDVGRSDSRESRSVEQFIVTVEGSPARISVGKRLPFTERWLLLARRHAQVVESVGYQSVDTGFDVLPALAGSHVQLDIRPFLAFQDPARTEEIRFQELNTRVLVPLGQWLDLGGAVTGSDEVSREILGVATGATGESRSVRVRVELQQP